MIDIFKWFRPCLLISCAIVGTMSESVAAQATQQFDITESDLDAALRLYAIQSGRQILYPPQLVDRRRAPAIRGRFSPEAALRMLLRDTGLTSSQTAGGVVTLHPAAASTTKTNYSRVASIGTITTAAVQEASSPAATTDDIVVTARRREESLQEVPVAVTAFTGEMLREKNIRTFYDVAVNTPGLVVRPGGGSRNTADFFIRGQGTTFSAGPGVVTYVADAPTFSTTIGNSLQFYDLASVQVLKGPQGTLFGRSSTGGAVLVEPQRPTERLGGFAEVRVGNYNMREVTAAVNIPIIEDKLMLRVAGNIQRRDGYTISTTTGQDLDDRHRDSYRVGLLFRPTEWLESYTLFYGENVDENSTGSVMLEFNERHPMFNLSPTGTATTNINNICNQTNPGNAAGAAACVAQRRMQLTQLRDQLIAEEARYKAGGSVRRTPTSLENFLRGHSSVLQNVTRISLGKLPYLGEVTFKNIAATPQRLRVGTLREIGGNSFFHSVATTHIDIINNELVYSGRAGGTLKFFNSYSNEFQVSGSSRMVDWVVGYFREVTKTPFSLPVASPTFNFAFAVPINTYSFNGAGTFWARQVNTAPFAQATVHLDPLVGGLSVTGGYRQSKLTRRGENFSTILLTPEGGMPGSAPVAAVPINDEEGSYTLAVDYKVTPDLLLYATHRKGYKPGGANNTVVNIPGFVANFGAEVVKDVEVGLKWDWEFPGVRGRANLAYYDQSYTDIQRNQTIPNPNPPFQSVAQVNNVAGAKLKGFEFEGQARVGDRVTVNVNYSHMKAGYTDFPGTTIDDRGVATPNIETPFVGTPAHQVSASLNLLAVSSPKVGDISLSTNYYVQSGMVVDDNLLQDSERNGKIKGFDTLNLRADWRHIMGSNIDAALFMTNVQNDARLISTSNLLSARGNMAGIFSEPRMYGIELRYRWGE